MNSKSDKERVVEKIVGSLSSLDVYNFSEPTVKSIGLSTTITLKLRNIAIEVEIDWMDQLLSLIIARLSEGEIPDGGYYVSDGRPIRHYLQEVIRDRKWSVDQEALAEISPGKKTKKDKNMSHEDEMLEQFIAHKKALDSCIEKLVVEEDIIFPA